MKNKNKIIFCDSCTKDIQVSKLFWFCLGMLAGILLMVALIHWTTLKY